MEDGESNNKAVGAFGLILLDLLNSNSLVVEPTLRKFSMGTNHG